MRHIERSNTDMCQCGHMWVEHRWVPIGDGVETPCYQAVCACGAFEQVNGVVVEPGHDQFGTERAMLKLCRCKLCGTFTPGDVDIDLLLAIKDNYESCMARGVHPEWTIGGA